MHINKDLIVAEFAESLMLNFAGVSGMLWSHQRNHNSTNIEDICDGMIYKRLSYPEGPLGDSSTNITLTLNTDGVDDIFHSTSYSLWPILLTVNELPPTQRYRYCMGTVPQGNHTDSKINVVMHNATEIDLRM